MFVYFPPDVKSSPSSIKAHPSGLTLTPICQETDFYRLCGRTRLGGESLRLGNAALSIPIPMQSSVKGRCVHPVTAAPEDTTASRFDLEPQIATRQEKSIPQFQNQMRRAPTWRVFVSRLVSAAFWKQISHLQGNLSNISRQIEPEA